MKKHPISLSLLAVALLFLAMTACSALTRPTEAPYTKPSALVGDWQGTTPDQDLVTLHGDGETLTGAYADGRPVLIRDNGTMRVWGCDGQYDSISVAGDGFVLATRTCIGGYWRLTRVVR